MVAGPARKSWLVGAVVLAALSLVGGCDREGPRYPGARPRLGWPAPQTREGEGVIRVLLLVGREVRLAVQGGGYDLWDLSSQRKLTALADGTASLLVNRSEGRWQIKAARAGGSMDVVPLAASVSGALEVRPRGQGLLLVAGPNAENEELRPYRGNLRLIARPDSQISVVNVVGVEDYLPGVVAAEVYASWCPAALRAQSIACRSYALWQIQRSDGRGDWDIGSDENSQVYQGVSREDTRVSAAVRATGGLVLKYGRHGQQELFPTYYSSVCGGHTHDAAAIFGESLVPLRGRRCPFCRAVARPHWYRWSISIPKKALSDALLERYAELAALATITDVRVVQGSACGRVEWLELSGSDGGRRRIKAQDFRLAVSTPQRPLQSNWYKLSDAGASWRFHEGRGRGHGVGMCQCGCEGMARRGYEHQDILAYYYPESVLVKAY